MGLITTTRSPDLLVRFITPQTEISQSLIHDSVIGVHVTHSVSDGGGHAQITLIPNRSDNTGASNWYNSLTALDFVEISIKINDSGFVVVFRGFIETVDTEFSIAGGQPQQVVNVTASDWKKFMVTNTPYEFDDPRQFPTEEMITLWATTFVKYAHGSRGFQPTDLGKDGKLNITDPAANFTPSEMISGITGGFFGPVQTNILASFGGQVDASLDVQTSMASTESTEASGNLITFMPVLKGENFDPYTDIWTLLKRYQMEPFRELFIDEDMTTGKTTLYYRPTPWLDVSGLVLQPSTTLDPDKIITDALLIQLNMAHGDDPVRTFIATVPEQFQALVLAYNVTGRNILGRPGNPHLIGANGQDPQIASSYKRFGFRQETVFSPYFAWPPGLTKGQIDQEMSDAFVLMLGLNQTLGRAFDHCEYLEFGSVSVAGDPTYRVGQYVSLSQTVLGAPGSFSRYYVDTVTHDFTRPSFSSSGQYATTMNLVRGRGYIDRNSAFIQAETIDSYNQ